ncbi:hypothetical protein ACH5RR_032027 [Cinchona calisaya]|uniref:Uncharacterized protein n=1 Tax=Cinchona calisaya TaxID=153742 RepID=A0ABD2YGY3_9GENT
MAAAAAATKSSSDQLQHPQRPPLSESNPDMENIPSMAQSAFKLDYPRLDNLTLLEINSSMENIASMAQGALDRNSIPHLDKKCSIKQKDIEKSLHRKHLLVCFMVSDSPDLPMSYSIWSVPIEGLLTNYWASSTNLRLLYSWANKHECYRRSFFKMGSRLYFFGGQMRDDVSRCFSCSSVDLSKEVFYLDLSNPTPERDLYRFVLKYPLKGMQSSKSEPIAVEIGGKLYVLAGPPYSDPMPNPSFEVYDPCANTWSALKPPPLLVESSQYFHGWTADPLAYVVIGKKLCISSQRASFAYDTVRGRWEGCKLFDGLYGRHALRTLWGGNVFGNADEIRCGSPFAFQKGAIIYDGDILICAGTPPFLAVAYHLYFGKAVKKQGLVLENNAPNKSCDYLVHLGGGFFCCMYQMDSKNKVEGKSKFSLVTFKISKLSGALKSDPKSNFLYGEVVSRSNHKIHVGRPFVPIFSFTV